MEPMQVDHSESDWVSEVEESTYTVENATLVSGMVSHTIELFPGMVTF